MSWAREPKGLYEPIGYVLSGGGKRLRPRLALAASAVYDGDEQEALAVALAIELFHNFTLVHDDVMDAAPVRRGRPTVHMRWDENTAILSGDQMMTEAYMQLERLSAERLPRALHLFNRMATDIWRGQQLDMEFEKRNDVQRDEYIEMVRLKTSVLIGMALRLGGLTAGASDADQERLYRIGEHMGLAFQVQDDILDVWGDERTFGKRIGGDIVQNKKSLVQIEAIAHANAAQRAALEDWLRRKEFDEQQKISEVRALYDAIGARAVCEEQVARYTAMAQADIDALEVPEQKKTELRKIVAEMMNRKH